MRTAVNSMSALRSAVMYNGNGDRARQTTFAPVAVSQLSSVTPPTSKLRKKNCYRKRNYEASNTKQNEQILKTESINTNQLTISFLTNKQVQPNQCQWLQSGTFNNQFSQNHTQHTHGLRGINLYVEYDQVQEDVLPHSAAKSLDDIQSNIPTATATGSLFLGKQIPIEYGTINDLLVLESKYHPNYQILLNVNHEIDDKVDAILRNEAVSNLRFLHKGFFHLSQETFMLAVNLIDRFAVKVKVKPKYLACVSMACYSVAAEIFESAENNPSFDDIINVSKCGGTVEDFIRMKDIIKTKLNFDLRGKTCLNFIEAFCGCACIPRLKLDLLDIVLCSLEVYRFRASCLALTLLTMSEPILSYERRQQLAILCQITNSEMAECEQFIRSQCDSFYQRSHTLNRETLVWTLSKRTLKSISSSSQPLLATIVETE